MKFGSKQIIAIVAVIVVIIAVIVIKTAGGKSSTNPTTVTSPVGQVTVLKGLIGSEKEDMFNDKEFQDIALKDYSLQFEASKAGSLEMLNKNLYDGKDFIFPANEGVIDKFKSQTKTSQVETIFRTPVVFYTWDTVVQPLIKKNIVKNINNTHYVIDFPALIKLITDDKKWADVDPSLKELYGTVAIITSDPAKSNSGNSFAAMVATILNNGTIPRAETSDAIQPEINKVFSKLGFKKSSTSDVFNDYMTKGLGASPMIAGYESDMIAFANNNKDSYNKLMGSVKPTILYPEPTLWSTHDIVAITPQAKKMIDFLKDKRIQKIAWERYGFRTGVLGEDNDFSTLTAKGVPQSINNVMQIPDFDTMTKIVGNLK